MFRVDVETSEAYFAFEPKREADLDRLVGLIRTAAPSLKPSGTPEGESGMRFKMIGYGGFFYRSTTTTGGKVGWPVVGVALEQPRRQNSLAKRDRYATHSPLIPARRSGVVG